MTKFTTNLQRNNFNNLSNAIDYAFTQKMLNINTSMVCVFERYDIIGSIKYGQVTQLINNIDADKKSLINPIQFNVPIGYIMGGIAGINVTYEPNDLVLVLYSQQSLETLKNAWNSGETNPTNLNPISYGRFTLEDGIILCKISPIVPQIIIDINNNGININSNNTLIQINSGSMDTNINCNNATIAVTNNFDVNATTINLNGTLNINGKAYLNHSHNGTGTPTPIGNLSNSGGNVTGNTSGVVP